MLLIVGFNWFVKWNIERIIILVYQIIDYWLHASSTKERIKPRKSEKDVDEYICTGGKVRTEVSEPILLRV